MDEFIKRLKDIKKEGLTEREFYEAVLLIVQDMGRVNMGDGNFELLKSTLLEIGCKEYKQWKKEKEDQGLTVEEHNFDEGIERADIGTAVNFVSQLLYTKESAMYGLSMLDVGEKYGWVQQWLKHSKDLREKGDNSIDTILERIRSIKKEGLSERQFYEEVLTVIKDLEKVDLKDEDFDLLKGALLDIGCREYSVWKAQKERKGESIDSSKNIGEGIEKADIATAVSFVSQLLHTKENAMLSLPYMLVGGVEKYGCVQQWLRNSKNIDNQISLRSIAEIDNDKPKEVK